ncbi:MAG: hypothetical protein R3E39_07470 [Anaerolineae bacterium]
MDTLSYQPIDHLRKLSLNELQALWELVPTDRQRAYKAAYDREVRSAGAVGSDALERQVAAELLKRYGEAALVPVGARWARTPGRVQEAASQNVALDAPEDELKSASNKPSTKVVLVLGLLTLAGMGFLVTHLVGGGKSSAVAVTPHASLTPTPRVSPTPTPLALEDQDAVIQGGDSAREAAYPVSLQITMNDDTAPRVWVVQRRKVQASEWNFDPNPDTASFVSGMSVRPVIGIPWSEENADFFGQISAGTSFLLTMNTGAELRFVFDDKRQVRRSETSIFRQVSPGLALLLIGERDSEGNPTAVRTLVTAIYPPEQELSRDGLALGTSGSMQEGKIGDQLSLGKASITLHNTQTLTDAPNLPAGMQYLLLDFEVAAGEDILDTTHWQIEFMDSTGQVYPASSDALTYTNYDALPAEIPALSSLSSSAGYLIPQNVSSGRWLVADNTGNSLAFSLSWNEPNPSANYEGVDVRLVSVTYSEGQITTRLRIYNGQSETLHFTQDDIWLALGFAPEPPGPRNPAEGLTPFDLLPEQAIDLTLVWHWDSEPYASMGVGEYKFSIQLTRG